MNAKDGACSLSEGIDRAQLAKKVIKTTANGIP